MKKEVELYTNKNTKITSKGNRKKRCDCKMSASVAIVCSTDGGVGGVNRE